MEMITKTKRTKRTPYGGKKSCAHVGSASFLTYPGGLCGYTFLDPFDRDPNMNEALSGMKPDSLYGLTQEFIRMERKTRNSPQVLASIQDQTGKKTDHCKKGNAVQKMNDLVVSAYIMARR